MKSHFDQGSPAIHFFCGAASGVLATISVYPLEVARTRMAMQGPLAKLSLVEIIRGTFRSEGRFSGLYKGGLASVLGTIVYKGVGFSIYELLKSSNKARLEKSLNLLHFSSGALAGFIGQFGRLFSVVSYPIEVAKRKMQVSGSFVSDKPTSSTSSLGSAGFVRTFYEMVRHEGPIKGGFKGFSLNMIKGPIANGIAFSTKHFIEREVLTKAIH